MIYDLRFKNKAGFTLIELIVAVTIGIIIIGFGSVALNNFNEKQKIETVKKELITNLRLARNYAVTNQLNGATKVVVSIGQNGDMLIEDDQFLNVFFNKDISPNGIKITAPIKIYFSVNDGRSVTSATPLIGTTVVVTVDDEDGDGSSIKTINIDESGLIYEK